MCGDFRRRAASAPYNVGHMDATVFAAAQLGLKAGAVAIVDHNPAWSEVFETLADEIRVAFAEIDCVVEHVGSTSVPGLVAKPIIDVAIGLSGPIVGGRLEPALHALGFDFATDLGDYGGLLFTKTIVPDLTVANLHIVDREGFQWRRYLSFRHALRGDPVLRAEYGELKRREAARYPDDRPGYANAKFQWVLDVVQSLDRRDGPGRP